HDKIDSPCYAAQTRYCGTYPSRARLSPSAGETLVAQIEVSPAEGERRALLGYVPQYRVCARLVYDAILQGSFDWLELQSNEAGQIDDFVIASPGRLDAYQVKHGGAAITYTLASLLRPGQSRSGASNDTLMNTLCL